MKGKEAAGSLRQTQKKRPPEKKGKLRLSSPIYLIQKAVPLVAVVYSGRPTKSPPALPLVSLPRHHLCVMRAQNAETASQPCFPKNAFRAHMDPPRPRPNEGNIGPKCIHHLLKPLVPLLVPVTSERHVVYRQLHLKKKMR